VTGPSGRAPVAGVDRVLVGLCLSGAALSLVATFQTLQIQSSALGTMLCSVTSWLDCRAAHASRFASVGDVPVAWGAFLFYLWIGVAWVAAVPLGIGRRAVAKAAGLLTLAALLVCAVEAGVMVFRLRTLCPVCLALDANTGLLAWALLKARAAGRAGLPGPAGGAQPPASAGPQLPASAGPSRRNADLAWCGASFVFLAVAGVACMWGVHGVLSRNERIDEAAAVREYFRHQPGEVVVPAGAPTWGTAGARVVVVMYSDFQCPFCKPAGLTLARMLADYQGSVALRFVNYPLDGAVNPYVPRSLHPLAGLAAAAALCAQERGQFWGFHDDLFRNQERLSERLIGELARRRGWSTEAFAARMRSEGIAGRLREDVEAAHRSGVTGTPSIFINGRPVRHWYHPRVLREILRVELGRSRPGQRQAAPGPLTRRASSASR
jgi:protein-disulfide isomerase/uncharacterized membrane protein